IITFEGVVSPGGGAGYGADLEGASGETIGGAGIVCDGSDANVGSQEVDDPTEVPTEADAQPTQETSQATPTGGHTAGETRSGDDASPDPIVTEQPTVETQDTAVSVSVAAWDCAVDPGKADPSTVSGCEPSVGVSINGNADSVDLGSQSTDSSGFVAFSV